MTLIEFLPKLTCAVNLLHFDRCNPQKRLLGSRTTVSDRLQSVRMSKAYPHLQGCWNKAAPAQILSRDSFLRLHKYLCLVLIGQQAFRLTQCLPSKSMATALLSLPQVGQHSLNFVCKALGPPVLKYIAGPDGSRQRRVRPRICLRCLA